MRYMGWIYGVPFRLLLNDVGMEIYVFQYIYVCTHERNVYAHSSLLGFDSGS
jgi:hypothetical protein